MTPLPTNSSWTISEISPISMQQQNARRPKRSLFNTITKIICLIIVTINFAGMIILFLKADIRENVSTFLPPYQSALPPEDPPTLPSQSPKYIAYPGSPNDVSTLLSTDQSALPPEDPPTLPSQSPKFIAYPGSSNGVHEYSLYCDGGPCVVRENLIESPTTSLEAPQPASVAADQHDFLAFYANWFYRRVMAFHEPAFFVTGVPVVS